MFHNYDGSDSAPLIVNSSILFSNCEENQGPDE